MTDEERKPVSVRVTDRERRDIQKAAERDGLKESAWMRTTLVKSARAILDRGKRRPRTPAERMLYNRLQNSERKP